MKVIVGSDHAGYEVKNEIITYLEKYIPLENIVDWGCFSMDKCNYPQYAHKVCKTIVGDNIGILICGTGIGMSIVANRYTHIRCALCHDEFTTISSREHNNANVIALGARVLNIEKIKKLIHLFLFTPFSGEERHVKRINSINIK